MNGWLKVLAVSSALTLGGGYVWWSQERASARREKEAARETQILPGSKSFVFSGEAAGEDYRARSVDEGPEGWKGNGRDKRTNADFIELAPEPKKERTVLPSSKLGLVPPPQQEGKGEPKKDRTIFPGSKSAPIGDADRQFIERILKEREERKRIEEAEKKRTVLPGSKSIDRILEPPDLEKKSEP